MYCFLSTYIALYTHACRLYQNRIGDDGVIDLLPGLSQAKSLETMRLVELPSICALCCTVNKHFNIALWRMGLETEVPLPLPNTLRSLKPSSK